MSIWNSTSIEDTPHIALARWRVYQTETGEHHFVGYNMTEREGRVSSAIQSFDKNTRIGITRSGRHYKLSDNSGANLDAEYVWGRWVEINKVTEITDVTEQYEQTL
jgi:hypothetical protein